MRKVNNSETFMQNLKILRNDESQGVFSARLGISQVKLSRLETGKCQPDLEAICNICIKCRVSADWLLGLERGGGAAGPADGVGPRVGRARLDGLKAAIRSLLDQY